MGEKLTDKFISLIKEPRIILLIVFVLISIFLLNFAFGQKDYIVIDGIAQGSLTQKVGMNFDNQANLRSYEKILAINNKLITSIEDYYNIIENESELFIVTDKNPSGYTIDIPQNDTNIGISVREAPSSNLHLGMEFEGGSRFIVKPQDRITQEEYDILKDSLQSRLDIYGVSGTKVEKMQDPFSDEQLLIIESTSSNKNDISQLIQRQGNFEARIGNVTVLTGDDVLHVFPDPRHSMFKGCVPDALGYKCSQSLSFEISDAAAQNFYDACKDLDVQLDTYLSEKIFYYLDGKEVINLSISSVFKYKKEFNHVITFPGNPSEDEEVAIESSNKEKKFLITIMSTKSLPSKLDIVQSYSISSAMGEEFLSNALLVGFLALLIVAGTIAIRYQKLSLFVGIVIALLSEIVILLGIAVFMKITIDLAAIGGIIAAIGTGVDDQIIITDEQLRGKNQNMTSKKRLKSALLIILISYLTTIAAMIPLLVGGLSMLKGFSFMIIIGVSIGVFITRPAYAKYLIVIITTKKERLEENEEEE